MRRLLRWLLRVGWGCAAVLTIAVPILWVRSYRAGDYAELVSAPSVITNPLCDIDIYTVQSGNGFISLGMIGLKTAYDTDSERAKAVSPRRSFSYTQTPPYSPILIKDFEGSYFAWAGIEAGFADPPPDSPAAGAIVYKLTTPYWTVLLLIAPLAIIPAVRFMRRKRCYPEGHCSTCGYDLRESPDRCPECGNAQT